MKCWISILAMVVAALLRWTPEARAQTVERLCMPTKNIELELKEGDLKEYHKDSKQNPQSDEEGAMNRIRDKIADDFCKGLRDPTCADPDRECTGDQKCKVTLIPRPQTEAERRNFKFFPGNFRCGRQGATQLPEKLRAGFVCNPKHGWYKCTCRCR